MLGVENSWRKWYTYSRHLGTELIQFLDRGTQLVFPRYLAIVGPLPVTQRNNKYILTFQYGVSKYVVAVPNGQQDA